MQKRKSAAKLQQIFQICKVLSKKSSLCLHKRAFLCLKDCSLHKSANVSSEGTRPEGEGACRSYYKSTTNLQFLFHIMRTHEACRFVFRVVFRALYGEVYLVLSEAFVDAVDGIHQPFLAKSLVCGLRCKKVQLYAGIALQL